ncbi:polynucleotide adenylyltransferase PcnB [Estrella lausannensis]|uniref:Poly(A) polymerase I n=1 Tax=Estrella lausannensis TaxID=483423 RepID=A0A0H5DS78_9BACT|nr:polynucleotide adenylyltransferase PcnB [Estrella lausannensis]CRX39143.1 Poly(A) polymerase [Estrella lausannensis]
MLPKTYLASDHDIDSRLIDEDALYVIETLRNAGHKAYLVGGSVRDLLTKKTPKDFDISTSAKPEEIKALFQRRCLLIGRRFRLAHIRFGHKVIEVATFRSGDTDSQDLITHDNRWGTEEEDVMRRDFTINGLFYDPSSHIVIDYVGGWEDTRKGILRSIGDPLNRFRQDPVRMIRILKFIARLGFKMSKDCADALQACKTEIVKSSPSRLLEEVLKMMESGFSFEFFKLLSAFGILELIFPDLYRFLKTKKGDEVYHYLRIIDQVHRKHPKAPLDRSILVSCLLYPALEQEIENEYIAKGTKPHLGQIIFASTDVIKNLITHSFSHFPRRLTHLASYILSTQYRFTPLTGKRHAKPKFTSHKEFPLALTFFKLRAVFNPTLTETYESWKKFHQQKTRPARGAHHPPPKRRQATDEESTVPEKEAIS